MRRRREDSHDGAAAMVVGRRGEAEGQAGVTSSPPLAVFMFPSEMVFHSEQRSSHRRVLTLYNPYSFSISFKMWCTAPSLYRVVEAEGSVRAKSCIDLVVRHLDVSPHNWGRRDRFRMEVRGGGQVGGREIWAELRGGGGGGGEDEEEQRRTRIQGVMEERRTGGQLRALSRPSTPLSPLVVSTSAPLQLPTCTVVRSVSQWVLCVLVAVLCVTVLMLPLHTDTNSMVPRCLHVSTNQKLVCAYTLGLLTAVFLR